MASHPARALVATLAGVLALPAAAAGNGRFPTAQYLLAGPGGASRTLALRTTFGLVVSDDGGASFRYLCETALGYGPRTGYDPPLAMDRGGRLFVGLPDGLVRVAADRCAFRREPALEALAVADLDTTPDGVVLVAAVTDGAGRGRVVRSDDGGDHWLPLGDGVPGVGFETLEVAPTDTARVYLTATTRPAGAVVFYRSDDGGQTLRQLPLPSTGQAVGAFVAGVDPTDAATVYVRLALRATFSDAGGVTVAPTALMRSGDGGQSWREVLRIPGSMLGFALSDDGRTLWAGGPHSEAGLLRSDDGGMSWRNLGAFLLRGLRQHAGTLYVCADEAARGWALGRSADRGDSVQALLRFADIGGPAACPPDSPAAACAAPWAALRHQYFATDAGRAPATPPPTDAGSARQAPPVADSGLCSPRPRVGGRWSPGALLLLAAVALGARRRPMPKA